MDEQTDLPPERNSSLRFWLLLAALAAAGVAWLSFSPQKRHEALGKLGELGELRLRPLTFEGETLALDDLKGKVVVLNFWGTWCPPCKRELPEIAELANRYQPESGCLVLAVSCGRAGVDPNNSLADLALDTKQLLKTMQLRLPAYADANGVTRLAVKEAVGFSGYPTTLLLDGRGVIRHVWEGYSPGVGAEIERLVETLLASEAGRG